MNRLITAGIFLVAVSCLPLPIPAASVTLAPFTVQEVEDGVKVFLGSELLTQYKTSPDLKYPYFYPVNSPSGLGSLTTESSEPYPHHHSLFFGCDRVNGGNYWQEGLDQGQIRSQKISEISIRNNVATFRNECLWQRPGAEPPFRDIRRIAIRSQGGQGYWIDFDITLEALMDVRIEKTNHSLFAARMIPDLSVKSGGTLVNAEGKTSEAGTFGVPSAWCDYSGTRHAKTEGLAILSHPQNRGFPEPWFTRDYGFFSPTPMNWLEKGYWEIPKGEKIHLQYRVVVHSGRAEEAGIETIYREWSTENQ